MKNFNKKKNSQPENIGDVLRMQKSRERGREKKKKATGPHSKQGECVRKMT